jgi:sphinganine-1-phosphate aldolase
MADQFPKTGWNREELQAQLKLLTASDTPWRDGHLFGYVYYPGDEFYSLIKEVFAEFSATNALNPAVFPSLQQMENEIIGMASSLLHGDAATAGCLTSGGTESLFMAVKSAKAWGSKNNKKKPFEILLPETAHPALSKAADIMDIKIVPVRVDENFKTSLPDLKKKINEHTILLVGSAPSYPQGVIDPISEMAAIAQANHILMHVDACVGGFMLPFLKMEGVSLPEFDLSVPGVSSISADLHKYAYAAKGASVILYKNAELRHGQFYVKTDWSGGVYGSPSFMGTRGGSAIAAAWAALHVIGENGYRKMALDTYNETQKIIQAIKTEMPALKILGDPPATLFAIASDEIDVYDIADEMVELGWTINRQQIPPSLHILMNNIHVGKGDAFIDALKTAVKKANKFSMAKLSKNIQVGLVKGIRSVTSEKQFDAILKKIPQSENTGNKRKAAMYGMMSELSGSDSLQDMVIDYLDKIYHKDDQNT